MNIKRTSMKILATATAVGALTVGGSTVAFAAEDASSSGSSAAVTQGGERARPLRHGIRLAFTTAAETLGLTPQELRGQMQNGPQSIASVAGDRTEVVTTAIVSALNARIDEAVASGKISVTRADLAKGRLPELAQRLVNRVPGQHAQH